MTGAVSDRSWRAALRGASALFALGTIGVLALAVSTVPALREIPGLESMPFPALVALAAANSTILLAVAVLVGAVTAPRVGLRSHVYARATTGSSNWGELRESPPVAVGVGAALFALAALLDAGFGLVATGRTGAVLSDAETLRALAASTPVRLLYGGMTEELLLRWGVLSPIAWAVWRGRGLLGGVGDRPSPTTAWVAIVVSAVLFGVGHLPALATTVGLTPALVVRTVVINAVVGVGLGWLFWRRSLETAMVAHASFHVALLVASATVVLAT